MTMQVNITPTGNDFAPEYNYPTFSVGLRYNLNHGTTMHRDEPWGEARPVDYTSKLGNILTLYSTFNRPLYRSRRWQWGYYLGTGIGYTALKYNQQNDIDNEYIGSHLNIFFTAGLYGQYKFAKEWCIKGGMDFAHHSNGAMARPNKGANYLGPFVGIVYEPEEQVGRITTRRNTAATEPFLKYWFMEFTLGIGGKTLLEEWLQTQFNTPQGQPDYRKEHFAFYGAYSLHAHLLYRYTRRGHLDLASASSMEIMPTGLHNSIRRTDILEKNTVRGQSASKRATKLFTGICLPESAWVTIFTDTWVTSHITGWKSLIMSRSVFSIAFRSCGTSH